MTGGRCADPVDGAAHQVYRATQPLLRGQAHSAVMPLLFFFASRSHPVCGPLPTTRWQLPAVIDHGWRREVCSQVINTDPSWATAT